MDLRPYQGITLWACTVGPATQVGIKLATPDTLDESYGGTCSGQGAQGCDDHYAGHRILTTSWTKYRVAFADLEQSGWGIKKDWHPERVVEIHVSVERTVSGPLDYDLWLDDLRLY